MPKSKDPSTYHPMNAKIFAQCNAHGSFKTGALTKEAANSLRFDLNGYRVALRDTNHPDWDAIQFSSVSCKKLPKELLDPEHPELTHYIEVFAAGPAWTEAKSYKAIMQGMIDTPPVPSSNPTPIEAPAQSLEDLLADARPKG